MSIPFIVGNWKMNGLGASLEEAQALADALRDRPAKARVGLCAPATLVERMARALNGTKVEVGGQDCHSLPSGAYTGDVSGEMLADAGARLVILGHSERREGHNETDAVVASKVEAALNAGLEPIVCIGESLEQRKAGLAVATVCAQAQASLPASLKGRAFAVAYEPIWAIGSGLTPSGEEIVEIHQAIRDCLAQAFGAEQGGAVPILYGGSVKPGNAAEILALPDVGGALVGGASLKCQDFLPIVRAGG
jgi:triosephosphate isomerase